MNRRQALLTAGAALAASAAAASARGSAWSRLDLSAGFVIARGTLAGQAVDLMLDSGSVPTLVDLNLARRLNLPLSGEGTAVGTSGGALAGARTGGFEIAVAGVTLQFPPGSVLALDLSGLGRPVEVILGKALFEAARLDLDLPKARIATGVAQPGDDWPSLPLTLEGDGLRCLPVSLGGRPPVAATFDLGAAAPPVQVSRAYAQSAGLLQGLRQSSWVSTGIDGAAVFTTAVLPRFDIAAWTMTNVPIAVVDSQPDGASPLLIGALVWRRFRLITDFAGQRLWLKANPRQLAAPFNRDRSGLAVRFDGARLEVIHVAPASPGEAGGWRVGERIVAVDGRPIDPRGPSRWARQKAGTRVRLTLADGAQRDLILADYY